ncbi:hypothetical protein [Mediterraneibacter sp. ICN-202921]|uniref:hypothetical protein n=1 Tax=Mediterraneibacter sp. ICN-202921 TaxID=3134657 RepID=UPI000E4A09C9|nr:hypothetical protein DWX08_00725 [Ruminococcus sp. AF18-22]
MSIKNVKVRFNLDKGNDRKAYEYLQGADVSYSKAVISAICGYMELSKTKAYEDAFLERVISTIREETAKTNPLGGLLQLVQQPVAQAPAEKENNAETEEAMLDFLDSF